MHELWATKPIVGDMGFNGDWHGDIGVNPRGLPSGNPSVPGASVYSAGTNTWTLTGAGFQIGDSTDRCQIVSMRLTGSFTMDALVNWITLPTPLSWASCKTGIMVRQTIQGPGAQSMVGLRNPALYPDAEIVFQQRDFFGGMASPELLLTEANAPALPQWLRLVRTGMRVTAYFFDGAAWQQVGETHVNPSLSADEVLACIFVCSHYDDWSPPAGVETATSAFTSVVVNRMSLGKHWQLFE